MLYVNWNWYSVSQMINFLSSLCVYPSTKIEICVAASGVPCSHIFLWSSTKQWVHISFWIKPSGPIIPAQLDTNWQLCHSTHAIMGWFQFICALLGSHWDSGSLWAYFHGLGTGWQSGGLSPTWARKPHHLRQHYAGFLICPARHFSSSALPCRTSLGLLQWQCSQAFWGFHQDKLGLGSPCVMEALKLEARVNLLLPRLLPLKIQTGKSPLGLLHSQ